MALWLVAAIFLWVIFYFVRWAVHMVVLYVQWKMPLKPEQLVEPEVEVRLRSPIPTGDMDVVLWQWGGEAGEVALVCKVESMDGMNGIDHITVAGSDGDEKAAVARFTIQSVVVQDVCRVFLRGINEESGEGLAVLAPDVGAVVLPDRPWCSVADYLWSTCGVDLDPYEEIRVLEGGMGACQTVQ